MKLKIISYVKPIFDGVGKGSGLYPINKQPVVKDIEEANRLLKLIIDKVYYKRHKEYTAWVWEDGTPEIEYDYIELKIAPR